MLRHRLLLPLCLLLAPAALAQEQPIAEPGAAPAASPMDALDDVAVGVVDRVAPSIVLIEVERSEYGPRSLSRMERAMLGVGDAYDPRYFSRPAGPASGVVVGPGLVATTPWNLEGDGAVHVITSDGRRLAAERLGRDENLDLALLKVEGGQDLPVLPPAPPEALQVGRFVMLVGRSAENLPLVSRGIVSALGRYRGDAFAHSARLNYATVGGALVDLEGRLLGIASRHHDRARQGQNSGVGFGSSWTKLQATMDALIAGTVVPRRATPFLGIQPDLATPEGAGVKISRLVPESAAEAAGIKAGDVIKIFNNVQIESFAQLREEIQALQVGAEIVITIVRDGQEQDFRVKLGGRQEEE